MRRFPALLIVVVTLAVPLQASKDWYRQTFVIETAAGKAVKRAMVHVEEAPSFAPNNDPVWPCDEMTNGRGAVTCELPRRPLTLIVSISGKVRGSVGVNIEPPDHGHADPVPITLP